MELTGVWALAAGGALFATLAGYAVLRLLRRLEKEAGLSRLFRGLLTGAAALLVFLAVWGALSGFLAQAAAVTAGNTGDPAGAARTNGVGAVLTLLGLTPSFLGAAVLLWGARLARALERDTARPLTPEQREAQVDYVRTNFDYDVMLDRYEEVYHHVIGDPLKEIPSQAKAHRKAAAAQGGAA